MELVHISGTDKVKMCEIVYFLIIFNLCDTLIIPKIDYKLILVIPLTFMHKYYLMAFPTLIFILLVVESI